MNTGYDKNGYITDYSKLNAFDKAQLDNAMEALDDYCYDHGYDGVDYVVETRIDGSLIIGAVCITVYAEGFDYELLRADFIVDFYGKVTLSNEQRKN